MFYCRSSLEKNWFDNHAVYVGSALQDCCIKNHRKKLARILHHILIKSIHK